MTKIQQLAQIDECYIAIDRIQSAAIAELAERMKNLESKVMNAVTCEEASPVAAEAQASAEHEAKPPEQFVHVYRSYSGWGVLVADYTIPFTTEAVAVCAAGIIEGKVMARIYAARREVAESYGEAHKKHVDEIAQLKAGLEANRERATTTIAELEKQIERDANIIADRNRDVSILQKSLADIRSESIERGEIIDGLAIRIDNQRKSLEEYENIHMQFSKRVKELQQQLADARKPIEPSVKPFAKATGGTSIDIAGWTFHRFNDQQDAADAVNSAIAARERRAATEVQLNVRKWFATQPWCEGNHRNERCIAELEKELGLEAKP